MPYDKYDIVPIIMPYNKYDIALIITPYDKNEYCTDNYAL